MTHHVLNNQRLLIVGPSFHLYRMLNHVGWRPASKVREIGSSVGPVLESLPTPQHITASYGAPKSNTNSLGYVFTVWLVPEKIDVWMGYGCAPLSGYFCGQPLIRYDLCRQRRTYISVGACSERYIHPVTSSRLARNIPKS